MRTLIPGEWYILFTCLDCKTRQIMFPDLSRGVADLRATYKVQCAKCGFVAKYESEDLERYEHPPTSDPKPIYCAGFFTTLILLRWFGWLRARARGRPVADSRREFLSPLVDLADRKVSVHAK